MAKKQKKNTGLFVALEMALLFIAIFLSFNLPLIYALLILIPMLYILLDYLIELFIFKRKR